jgi:HAD superfamily hydrolase (TIGR01509 family)
MRIASYAESRGDTVDAAAVHHTKSELFRAKLRASRPAPRPGLADTIEQARGNGYKLALVTTTSADNVTALADAMRPEIDIASFDLVVDSSAVERPKPDAEVYRFALDRLGETPEACVAVEDNTRRRAGRGIGRSAVRRLPGREQRGPRLRRRGRARRHPHLRRAADNRLRGLTLAAGHGDLHE